MAVWMHVDVQGWPRKVRIRLQLKDGTENGPPIIGDVKLVIRKGDLVNTTRNLGMGNQELVAHVNGEWVSTPRNDRKGWDYKYWADQGFDTIVAQYNDGGTTKEVFWSYRQRPETQDYRPVPTSVTDIHYSKAVDNANPANMRYALTWGILDQKGNPIQGQVSVVYNGEIREMNSRPGQIGVCWDSVTVEGFGKEVFYSVVPPVGKPQIITLKGPEEKPSPVQEKVSITLEVLEPFKTTAGDYTVDLLASVTKGKNPMPKAKVVFYVDGSNVGTEETDISGNARKIVDSIQPGGPRDTGKMFVRAQVTGTDVFDSKTVKIPFADTAASLTCQISSVKKTASGITYEVLIVARDQHKKLVDAGDVQWECVGNSGILPLNGMAKVSLELTEPGEHLFTATSASTGLVDASLKLKGPEKSEEEKHYLEVEASVFPDENGFHSLMVCSKKGNTLESNVEFQLATACSARLELPDESAMGPARVFKIKTDIAGQSNFKLCFEHPVQTKLVLSLPNGFVATKILLKFPKRKGV